MSQALLNFGTDWPVHYVPWTVTEQSRRPTFRPTLHSFVKDQSENILGLLNLENGGTTPLRNAGSYFAVGNLRCLQSRTKNWPLVMLWGFTVKTKVHPRADHVGPALGVEVYLYSLFNLGARWGCWSAPRPGRFTPWKETRYPSYRRLAGPHGRSGRMRKISPSHGFDPRTARPVASRYIYWAIAALGDTQFSQ